MPAKTHGASRDRGLLGKAYRAWVHMLERCTKPKHPEFKRYGGRGIKMCNAWVLSFDEFLDAVGLPPSFEHSIDRFPDNDGDYRPGNCRWATYAEQNANKRQGNQAPLKTLAVMEEVKKLHAEGWSTRRIAAQVGLGKSQVWKIVAGLYDEAGQNSTIS